MRRSNSAAWCVAISCVVAYILFGLAAGIYIPLTEEDLAMSRHEYLD